MNIRAVYFDFGGVLVRTEDREPRTRLAERLGMSYKEIEGVVFGSESSRLASTGKIPEEAHWQACAEALGVSREEMDAIGQEFFAGDVIDTDLLDYLRSLRQQYKVGLISNAWSGLRAYIVKNGFEDAFDHMVISAEMGMMKPAAKIYQHALEQFGVTPQEAVFVDDFQENITGAQAIGMQAIHFTDPQQALQQLKSMLNSQV
jgi:epoxide hydrolase-like predicted phosphatase